jgi:hypothetical protein
MASRSASRTVWVFISASAGQSGQAFDFGAAGAGWARDGRGVGLALGGFQRPGAGAVSPLPSAAGLRRVLAFFQQGSRWGVDLHALGALGDQDLAHYAFVHRLEFHRGLVGLDLGEDIAGRDRVALLHQPFRERAFLHRGGQRGHQNFGCHVCRSPSGVLRRHVGVDVGPELVERGLGAFLGELGGLVDDVLDLLVDRLEIVLVACLPVSRAGARVRWRRASRASSAPPRGCGTWPDRTSNGRDSGRS